MRIAKTRWDGSARCQNVVRVETLANERETTTEWQCVGPANHMGECHGPPVGSPEYRHPKVRKTR
jgi:hypothetical protein